MKILRFTSILNKETIFAKENTKYGKICNKFRQTFDILAVKSSKHDNMSLHDMQ